MVVTFLLATSESCVWHERTALPSTWTVQAPHNPAPQPNFVPVSLRCSRTIHSNGVSGSASTLTGLPLRLNATVVMRLSLGVSVIARGIFRLVVGARRPPYANAVHAARCSWKNRGLEPKPPSTARTITDDRTEWKRQRGLRSRR